MFGGFDVLGEEVSFGQFAIRPRPKKRDQSSRRMYKVDQKWCKTVRLVEITSTQYLADVLQDICLKC